MRETLTVLNPFADELLTLWLETVDDGDAGTMAADFPAGWHERAGSLRARYEVLAEAHTRSGKHLRPKENLAVLRAAVDVVAGGGEHSPRQRGMQRNVVGSMVARRGRPGSPEYAALRLVQALDAAPCHHLLARVVVVVVARVAALDPEAGLRTWRRFARR